MIVFVNDPRRTRVSISVPKVTVCGKIMPDILTGWLNAKRMLWASWEEKDGRVLFNDITGTPAQISDLIRWINAQPEKIYILVSSRIKGGKKHVSKDRAEPGEGRESGDREGADSHPGHGEADRVGGADDSDRDPGFESDPWTPEGAGADDDCD